MVINWLRDPAHALDFAIFDHITRKRLDTEFAIFYADDQAGIVRYYQRDSDGVFLRDGDGALQPAQLKRNIDIVRKA